MLISIYRRTLISRVSGPRNGKYRLIDFVPFSQDWGIMNQKAQVSDERGKNYWETGRQLFPTEGGTLME